MDDIILLGGGTCDVLACHRGWGGSINLSCFILRGQHLGIIGYDMLMRLIKAESAVHDCHTQYPLIILTLSRFKPFSGVTPTPFGKSEFFNRMKAWFAKHMLNVCMTTYTFHEHFWVWFLK